MLLERPVAVPQELHHQPLAEPSWGPCSTTSSAQDASNCGVVPQLLQGVSRMPCSLHAAAAPRTPLTSSATCDLDHTLSEQAASSSAPLRNSSLDSEDVPCCPTASVAPVRAPPLFLRSMSASESTLKEPNVKGERVRGGRGRKVASSCDLEGKVRGGIYRAASYRASGSLEVPRTVGPPSPDLCCPVSVSCGGIAAGQRHGGSSAFSCLAQQPGSQPSEAAGSLGSTLSGSALDACAAEPCPPGSPCPSMLGGRFSGDYSRRSRIEAEPHDGSAAADAAAGADAAVSPSALSPAGSGGASGGPAFPPLRWQGPGSAPFLLAAAPLPGRGYARSSSGSSSSNSGEVAPHAPAGASAPQQHMYATDGAAAAQGEDGIVLGSLHPLHSGMHPSASSSSGSSGLGSNSSGFFRPSASQAGPPGSGSLLMAVAEEEVSGDSDGGMEEGVGSLQSPQHPQQQHDKQQQWLVGAERRAKGSEQPPSAEAPDQAREGAGECAADALASQLEGACSLRSEQGSRGGTGGQILHPGSPAPVLSKESSLGGEWSGACLGTGGHAGQSYGSCGSGLSLLDFADESSNRGTYQSRRFDEPQSPGMYKVRPSGGGESPHGFLANLPTQSSNRSSNSTALSQVPSSLETLGGVRQGKVRHNCSLSATNQWPQQISLGHSYSMPTGGACVSPSSNAPLCPQHSCSSYGSLLDYAEACSRSPVRKTFARGSADIEAARQSSSGAPRQALP